MQVKYHDKYAASASESEDYLIYTIEKIRSLFTKEDAHGNNMNEDEIIIFGQVKLIVDLSGLSFKSIVHTCN